VEQPILDFNLEALSAASFLDDPRITVIESPSRRNDRLTELSGSLDRLRPIDSRMLWIGSGGARSSREKFRGAGLELRLGAARQL
jgi:hypothetical protein